MSQLLLAGEFYSMQGMMLIAFYGFYFILVF